MSNFKILKTTRDLERAKSLLTSEKLIACDIETSDINIETLKIEGIGVGTSDKQFYISYPNGFKVAQLRKFFRDIFKGTEVVFHHAKFDLAVLQKYKIPFPKQIHDTMIMSWLVEEDRRHGLKPLAKDLLGRESKKWIDIDKRPSLFRTDKDIAYEIAEYCCGDVKNTYDLYKVFLPKIKEEGVYKAYMKVEIPIIKILMNMELRGIKIDTDWLKSQSDKAEKILTRISKKLIKQAGGNINIHSPKQLEIFLFETLGYDTVKATPSGKRSTDNDSLEAIIKKNKLEKNEFVPLLLKFRDLDKLYRTYLLALVEQAGEDGILHTSFLQHGTRTGRLASRDPNLQNIPARIDDWEMRKAFVARPGHKFIISDYSQIELRVLAHFSQDKNMLKVFKKGGDIHAKTMELTNTKRRAAKAINFGLIYGMGPRSLARSLNIKETEAKSYIERFFRGYPSVRFWLRRTEQFALKKGYVQTITGRRRRFKVMTDNFWFNTVKRQAVNTRIQGSAADIIKIAMLKLDKVLSKLDSYQLLQIHDEIITEVPENKAKEIKKIINKTMEDAVTLSIPLKVHSEISDHWIKE